MAMTVTRRLGLAAAIVGLLMVALAYYWLDNAVHEIVGTVFFLLVAGHNAVHRRWYATLAARRAPRSRLDALLALCLAAAVLTLLVTGLMISRTVFALAPYLDDAMARRLHASSAYWVLALAALHIGIRWRIVLAAVRTATGPAFPIRIHSGVLRVAAAALAVFGLYSTLRLDIGPKLLLQMSLEWWDFEASTLGFFLHHAGAVGLGAVLAHYGFRFVDLLRPATGRGRVTPP
ncbi:MAG: hypothetical protein K0R58_3807 [Ramlibacter sp.]|jgi:hypothetical protein|nr:hypothetical protein [Ramlibacter sp.]